MKKKKSKKKVLVFLDVVFMIAAFGVTYKIVTDSKESVRVTAEANNKDSNNKDKDKNNNKIEDTKVDKNNTTTNNGVINNNDSSVSGNNTEVNNNNNNSNSNSNSSSNSTDSNNAGFTKDLAAKYFVDSEKEYKDYTLQKDNDEFFLCENGVKVIGLLFYDKEKSPETGLDYYGYRLVDLEYLKNGGSGTIEYGYIYEDGSISHD